MSTEQTDKANRFRALHTAPGTLGRLDGQIIRDEAFSQARLISGSTHLPVSADLENGFGHEPAFAWVG
ncbi:MAG: hypothetical protein QOI59_4514 [Gammaproteobacteria bacterium]|jgi:2-methylisocitrate lyase-like PEP mutase family enzyme|nr:hypothetical protein [Gammaproteobacteria bacterium]